jgi:energy-coupling factor transporter ATP-binding protein EcfA2
LSQILTRLYIDNFRCFVKFEYRPKRRQLILGANGSGKSSLIEALLLLHRFAVKGEAIDDLPLLDQRTRWLKTPNLTFELDAKLGSWQYSYRLVLEPREDRLAVASETVCFNGKPILEFVNAEVHLYDESSQEIVKYPIDWHRSALPSVRQEAVPNLGLFKHWLGRLVCFRLNPFAMGPLAKSSDSVPAPDLSNFVAWYTYLKRAPGQATPLLESLRVVLDGFVDLTLWPAAGANVLGAQFSNQGEPLTEFLFNELSDGQRCLICLYAILVFVLDQGNTVLLDEPDNFISLREIQPWLMAATDVVENGHGQLLLISHHPEIIDQWAAESAVRFVRDGIGAVRVEEFHGDPESALTSAELVARGWEHG